MVKLAGESNKQEALLHCCVIRTQFLLWRAGQTETPVTDISIAKGMRWKNRESGERVSEGKGEVESARQRGGRKGWRPSFFLWKIRGCVCEHTWMGCKD